MTEDAHWLRELELRRSAPAAMVRSAREGEVERFAAQLRKALLRSQPQGKKRRSETLQTLADLWPRAAESDASPSASLTACLFDGDLEAEELSGRIETILAASAPGESSPDGTLAACWLLTLRVAELEPQTTFDLWRWSREALARCVAQSGTAASFPGQVRQLELDLWNSSDIFFHTSAGKRAREATGELVSLLLGQTEKDGSPLSAWLPQLLDVISGMSRIVLAAEVQGRSLWSSRVSRRWEKLLLKGVLFLSPQRVLFSGNVDVDGGAKVIRRAARQGELDGQKINKLLKAALRNSGEPQSRKKERRYPDASQQSDGAGWAVLRPHWTGPVHQCAVRVAGSLMELELVADGVPVLSGEWTAAVRRRGQGLAAAGPWTCNCWFTDKDAAYAEFQQLLEDGSRLIRQLLLPTRDEFLLLAESIRGKEAGPWELSRNCELAQRWEAEQDAASREWALLRKGGRIRILPISSPQFRVERAYDQLTCTAGELACTSREEGQNLYSAVILDWSRERSKAGVDWNLLTVAEDGRACPRDEAVGIRWRVGEDQWILSHSFVPPRMPRTFMGLHTSSETVVSRVNSQGEFETLVEVEAGNEPEA